jgi:hypothetical protein
VLLPNYLRVKLITDHYEAEGAHYGDIGYIIEIFGDDAYMVEFSDDNGITYAEIIAKRHEIEPDDVSL